MLKHQSESQKYLEKTSNLHPRGLVKKFIQYLKTSDQLHPGIKVVDIGCGSGRDASFYINEGLQVTAIDCNPDAIEMVTKKNYKNITTKVCDICTESIPECHIASASFCMPFIPPKSFAKVWNQNIVPSILPGGYFVGHFFGNEHGWASPYGSRMTFLTKEQVEKLFDPKTSHFNGVIFFKETKKVNPVINGGSMFFHTITVYAQKKSASEEALMPDLSTDADQSYCALV